MFYFSKVVIFYKSEMTFPVVFLLVAYLAVTQCQHLHDHGSHAEVHGDVGIFNGQLVALDDITDSSRLHNFASQIGLPRDRLLDGNRGFVAGGGVALGGIRWGDGGAGIIGVGGGSVGIGGGIGLRQCRLQACTLQFIPANCRYTPVRRSLTGQYCLGCQENLCHAQRPIGRGWDRRQRRRQRRRQQRLCRLFGQCFGLGRAGRGGLGGGAGLVGGAGFVGGAGLIGGAGIVGGAGLVGGSGLVGGGGLIRGGGFVGNGFRRGF